jgi:hypothetical protein
MENVSVKFQVSGNELSAYMDSIKKKSDELTNSAIKGAIEQTAKSKEQLKIIDDQIKALERKVRIEGQAGRSVFLDKNIAALGANKDFFEGKRNEVYADKNLTEAQKKERILALTGREAESAEGIKGEYKENIKLIKEQERQQKLQTALAKENITTLRETAEKNVKAIQAGDLKLSDVIQNASTAEQKFVAQLTKEGLAEEDKKTKNEKSSDGGVLKGLLAFDNLNRAIGSVSQLVSTRNGFDLIGTSFRTTGTVLGSLVNEQVGKIMGELAGAAGDFLQRQAMSKQEYTKQIYRYNAVTGLDFGGNTNMVDVGVSATDFTKSQIEFAKRRGYAVGSDATARDAFYAEKGFGIDQGTSSGLVEMQRSSRENNRNLAELIGGVLEKGKGNIFKNGDNTFLNEFLVKFATLQKELLKSSTVVSTGTTMSLLSMFNKVGGEFDARDPRSMGNINAIHNALANPGSDNMKAVAYRILTEQNPNMGIFDIEEQMSKGVGANGYLKGMLGFVDRIGGSDQMKMKNMRGMFSGLSPSAVRRLFENKDALMNGSISEEELRSKYPDEFRSRAEGNTTPLEKSMADIETQLLNGSLNSAKAMVDAFKVGIENALSGAVINLNDGKGTIEFSGRKIIKNTTKTAISHKGLISSGIDPVTFGPISR